MVLLEFSISGIGKLPAIEHPLFSFPIFLTDKGEEWHVAD